MFDADSGRVAALVRGAAAGDGLAWDGLVRQFARLLWAITAEYRLTEGDAADVVQTTWLRLLEHIHRIERPERVGSWLATTARHECLRHLAVRKRIVLGADDDDLSVLVPDSNAILDEAAEIEERLMADERAIAVREAMTRLPGSWQRLLELLMADPPVPYAEISDRLGLPVGSIGPTRGRCLARLRTMLEPAP